MKDSFARRDAKTVRSFRIHWGPTDILTKTLAYASHIPKFACGDPNCDAQYCPVCFSRHSQAHEHPTRFFNQIVFNVPPAVAKSPALIQKAGQPGAATVASSAAAEKAKQSTGWKNVLKPADINHAAKWGVETAISSTTGMNVKVPKVDYVGLYKWGKKKAVPALGKRMNSASQPATPAAVAPATVNPVTANPAAGDPAVRPPVAHSTPARPSNPHQTAVLNPAELPANPQTFARRPTNPAAHPAHQPGRPAHPAQPAEPAAANLNNTSNPGYPQYQDPNNPYTATAQNQYPNSEYGANAQYQDPSSLYRWNAQYQDPGNSAYTQYQSNNNNPAYNQYQGNTYGNSNQYQGNNYPGNVYYQDNSNSGGLDAGDVLLAGAMVAPDPNSPPLASPNSFLSDPTGAGAGPPMSSADPAATFDPDATSLAPSGDPTSATD